MKDLTKLEKRLEVEFKDEDLLVQALVHRSYLNEHPRFRLPHNERLEFLGDAVLELSVTDYLFHRYDNPEGELTNWRASLVNASRCAEIAQEIGLEDYLYLSKGEAKDNNSKARNFILANALEAIIGAIYLDQGYKTASRFVERFVISKFADILHNRLYLDPKTNFQEQAQEKFGLTPSYKVIKETGPDHNKIFEVAVYLGEEKVASGRGSSKQEAQIEAAKRALEIKSW